MSAIELLAFILRQSVIFLIPVPILLKMSPVKNIIFDLGGVILDIDYGVFARSFTALGAEDFDGRYSQYKQHPLFDAFEMGLVNPDDFRPQMERLLNFRATPEAFDKAWNSIILNFIPERIELIKQLRQHKKVFLLSNTNLLHQWAYEALFVEQIGEPDFAALFDKAYYSHQIGMRKPNANVFEFVLKQNNLLAEETLFIDDTSIHTDTAASLGIQTIHLQKPQTILDIDWGKI